MLRKVQKLLQQFKILPSVTKMSEVIDIDKLSAKRPAEKKNEDLDVKKQKTEDGTLATNETKKHMKRKVAILMSYSGVGYKGMQFNKGVKTIEEELFKAMTKAEAVTESMAEHLGKMSFQRCARTDKGVSAAGQVVSMKMFLLDDVVDRINQHLPDQIRVMDYKRVINSFDSKNRCDYRTYSYMTPTFAFQPIEQFTTDAFRVKDETIDRVNSLLKYYHGSKNFHNFTSGKKFNDPSAFRYIKDFSCNKPFIQDGLEFSILKVRGQSFMLHQIRKMVGLILAVVRGLAHESVINKAFEEDKLDIPKAPGLGLVLESVHYDHYNEKWGSDGMHEALTWDESKDKVEAFKTDFIYPTIISTEKAENTMMTWLGTLLYHSYANTSLGGKLIKAKKDLQEVHTSMMEEKSDTDSKALEIPTSSADKQNIDTTETMTEETAKNEDNVTDEEERLQVKEKSAR
ncbi:pseudouridylate synthase 1 homolog isoform X1 [Antedon mediterranea]|uniref:pseudouridylate synthase 1 homolog isoform X1 n=1 Tax=Antedon mediterranea TaxID=105859 RepID=UPI003AF442DE